MNLIRMINHLDNKSLLKILIYNYIGTPILKIDYESMRVYSMRNN